MNSNLVFWTFFFGTIGHYICEGWTEAYHWLHHKDPVNYGKDDKHFVFHSWRTGEKILLALSQLILFSIFRWRFIIVHAMGLSLYQMVYSWKFYKNPLYNKTSKFLFIKHPPGWVWLLTFVIGIILLLLNVGGKYL